jgi:hypothetical protein
MRNPVERIQTFLSAFSCKHNEDIENFLRNNAIDFSNRGIARTHLITTELGGNKAILGYFALTNKIMTISPDNLSKGMAKKIERFGLLDIKQNTYSVPSPLIAQLAKNYTNDLNRYINGDTLLTIACAKVSEIQFELGGRLVYIECEDEEALVNFYSRNGFRKVNDETVPHERGVLVQMIKYL